MGPEAAFRVILSELASVGLDPEALCAAAGIDPRSHVDEAIPLGLVELGRVLEHAEAVARDSLLGLHMAERAQGRGVLSYLARAQRTVGEGVDAFARFACTTWGSPSAVRLESRGESAVVAFGLDPTSPRHALEFVVARTAISLRRSGARPTEVRFRREPGTAADDRESEYERVLGCPVRFGASEDAISVRSEDLSRPLRTASPPAAEALRAALANGSVAISPLLSVVARLSAAVEDALARGASLDREALARTLGMGGKTLSRRLAAEQRSFRDVVDVVRSRMAERLVADSSVDLTEAASRVGFADQASFGKAFRRWFGEPPSASRARRAVVRRRA